MEQSKLTSEWIQIFNRLGSEGKLKPTVPYHDLFNRKELKIGRASCRERV